MASGGGKNPHEGARCRAWPALPINHIGGPRAWPWYAAGIQSLWNWTRGLVRFAGSKKRSRRGWRQGVRRKVGMHWGLEERAVRIKWPCDSFLQNQEGGVCRGTCWCVMQGPGPTSGELLQHKLISHHVQD